MTRFTRLALMTAAGIAVGVSFAQSYTAQADMLQKVGAGEGEVAIVAWPGYIENGGSDKAYDWVTGFEKQTGCKVSVKVASTSDEMVSLLNAGGYDLLTASGDATMRLIRGGTVQEINTALIPSYSTIDPRLQNAPWHTVDGKHYGASWQWGPNVLMYNTEVFKEAPKSWDVVFKEMTLGDGKSNKGRIEAYGGPIYIADAALYLAKHNPELESPTPTISMRSSLRRAVDLLKGSASWSPSIGPTTPPRWTSSRTRASSPPPPGRCRSICFRADKDAKIKVAGTVPEEGATGLGRHHDDGIQCAAIPNCAYLWLEHSLAPKTQADVAAWFGQRPRRCRRPARARNCSATAVARPMATTCSTRSISGRRRSRIAARARPASITRPGPKPSTESRAAQ